MHFARSTWLIGCAAFLALAMPTSSQAQVFLVGAIYYSSDSVGFNSGGGYAYTTNSATFGQLARLGLHLGANFQNNAISFPLATGPNNFTFDVATSFPPGPFGGIEFFLSNSATSFNPAGSAGIPGNLAAFTATNNGGVFSNPAAGILVRAYDVTTNAPYSGATSFDVGGETVTITEFTSSNFPGGTFTLNVISAVPEPTVILLSLIGGLPLAGVAVWRYKKMQTRRKRRRESQQQSIQVA